MWAVSSQQLTLIFHSERVYPSPSQPSCSWVTVASLRLFQGLLLPQGITFTTLSTRPQALLISGFALSVLVQRLLPRTPFPDLFPLLTVMFSLQRPWWEFTTSSWEPFLIYTAGTTQASPCSLKFPSPPPTFSHTHCSGYVAMPWATLGPWVLNPD